MGVMGRDTVFAASCEFEQKMRVFGGFSQPLRIFSGGYGIELVQILAINNHRCLKLHQACESGSGIRFKECGSGSGVMVFSN